MRATVLFLLSLAVPVAPALAQDPMSGREFEAFVDGGTYDYARDGVSYGIETYLPGRRVLWAYNDDECEEGSWYEEEKGTICFLYPYDPGVPKCWNFWPDGERLRATFVETGVSTYSVIPAETPLACQGPWMGV